MIHWVATLVLNSWKHTLETLVWWYIFEPLNACLNVKIQTTLVSQQYGAVQVALLRDRVSAEVRMQQTLQHLQGVMQPLLHASVLEVENALK